jgi:hypothetical protein
MQIFFNKFSEEQIHISARIPVHEEFLHCIDSKGNLIIHSNPNWTSPSPVTVKTSFWYIKERNRHFKKARRLLPTYPKITMIDAAPTGRPCGGSVLKLQKNTLPAVTRRGRIK